MLNIDSVALDLIVGELYPVKGYASGSMTSMFISIYLHICILIYIHFVSTLLYFSAVGCRPATTAAYRHRRRVHRFVICCSCLQSARSFQVCLWSNLSLLWSLGGVLGSVKFVFTEVFRRVLSSYGRRLKVRFNLSSG